MDLGKDLVAASATPLVLAILAQGDSYGYAIIKRVAQLSGGHLHWTDGMLYPVLHRLERQGFVASKWLASENGRRRKYYRITKAGRAELAAQRQRVITDVRIAYFNALLAQRQIDVSSHRCPIRRAAWW